MASSSLLENTTTLEIVPYVPSLSTKMASSGLLENTTTLEIVPYILKLEKRKDQVLHHEMEQSPVTIPLRKVTPSREDNGMPDEEGAMRDDSANFSLKPQKGYSDDHIFVISVQVSGSTKSTSWSGPVNFMIPDDCEDYILQKDQAAEVAPGAVRVPLKERLEGWQIERRPRDKTNRFDKFYYHGRSGGRFRSFAEVQDFIIHARFQKARKPEEGSVPLAPLESESRKRKRKAKATREMTEEERRRIVEKFLDDSWNNLMNIGKQGRDLRDSTGEDEEPVILDDIRDIFDSENDEEKSGNPIDEVQIQEMINELMT
ncbi:hypothetical protein RHSIM_RhsimUnG0081800 [Rhododendron simsii]|uniref:MBD domain-containing protein n=1 Tax=Rhododendron simsii TaxID=118357 RepID=A0A834FVQ9_RHOSS|nr:hypothetical protein RHSIM_RhsimUnG0081800 [Rhododendron simsii]